jgi:hypothetical protein
MNSKQRKTKAAIFAEPTNKSIVWSDIESLLKAVGCQTLEGAGSRISFRFTRINDDKSAQVFREDFHRPHPGKEARAYQVETARAFLTKIGELP